MFGKKGKLSDEILAAMTKVKAKGKAPEAEPDDGDEDESEDMDVRDPAQRGKAAAQDLIDSLDEKDPEGVYEAVKALVTLCAE